MFSYNGLKYDRCESNVFNIFYKGPGKIEIQWKPEILELVKGPRYFGWFSSIDTVRSNAEVTLGCKFKDGMDINVVGKIVMSSMQEDFHINAAVRQCFMELGL